MDWMIPNPEEHDIFTSLGTKIGDTYTVSDDCLELLEEILKNLAYEDSTLRTFRRAIGFGQNIKKDLIPLLIYVKDDANINATKIIDTTIKILVNLTIPVDYLLPIDTITNTDVGRHTLFELSRLLSTSKHAFSDSRSTKAITDHMKYIMEKDVQLNVEQCDGINNCLLLLRNILHIPEPQTLMMNCTTLAHSSMQNQIIWNLFTQSIDKIIIYLLSCPQRLYWGVTIVQLIALMYKDQHLGTLQKLLNLWLESSLSDSSEDNESNTSPPDQGSGDSSPIITSDPTSDSSDNGASGKSNERNNKSSSSTKSASSSETRTKKSLIPAMKRNKSMETETSTSSGVSVTNSLDSASSSKSLSSKEKSAVESSTKKLERPSSQSEISDCGYATQVENENQESISTSSNDEEQPHQKPVHQKPHTFQKTRYKEPKTRTATVLEKKDLRRRKLVRRSKTNIINMKGLLHHQPTDEDVTHILKEFTVDFLLKGYGSLVQNLYSQFLSNMHVQIDTSHFFWLMTYFLKLATQLELDLEHVAPVLSYDILSFLVFQGVWLCEELDINCRDGGVDLKSCLRRLHLVVTAIREYLQAVDTYKKLTHLSEEDHSSLLKLQIRISETEDLMNLFVLLIRQYNPEIQSKQYLQDVILTNHNYLLFLDSISKVKGQSVNVVEHLKQFASADIMRHYGILLQDFKHNGEFVNNCVLTMMHHIGGDLENVSMLFQPSILKTFSQIWETDYELCDDWSDLIEYVIHKFINTRHTYYSNISFSLNEQHKKRDGCDQWTEEEKGNLLEYYEENINSEDTIARISKKYLEKGITNKTQTAIIKELLKQNIINENQYNDFMKSNQPDEDNREDEPKSTSEVHQSSSCIKDTFKDGEVRVLKEYIYKENKGKTILWLQQVLMEACFVKLRLLKPEQMRENQHIMEPSIYYYALLNLPIPIVPWFTEHSNILKYQPFVLLLQKLGFYLPMDSGKMFVRIPNFWNPENIFSIAQQLGPIDTAKLKFNVTLFKNDTETKTDKTDEILNNTESECTIFSSNNTQMPSALRYTPPPNTASLFHTPFRADASTIISDRCSQISGMNELTVTIPEVQMVCDMPPPKLSIVDQRGIESPSLATVEPVPMDCSPVHGLLDDAEHGSICDTASVASDLTRMCVSDEDEKILTDDDDI